LIVDEPAGKVLSIPFLFCFPSSSPHCCPNEDAQGAQVLNALQEIVLEVVGELGIQTRFPELQPVL